MAMIYRPLGRCGTSVSVFGLGGWTTFGGSVSSEQAVRSIIRAALEAGVNFFDMADVYSHGEAERAMGRALADAPRSKLVLSTKVYYPMSDDPNDRGLSRKHVMQSIDESLKRIGTDYIDVYFCHRFDDETPLEETVRAMGDLIRAGKVLYWGTSEFTGAQLRDAHQIARSFGGYPPQVEQPQYSLLARAKFEKDVRPTAAKLGMGTVVWSPLASGVLTGKYDNGMPKDSRLARIDWLRDGLLSEDRTARVRKFKAIADGLGASRAQVALAWAASRPGVSSVILGATKVEQLRENLGALEVKLTPEIVRELEGLFPVEGTTKKRTATA